MYGSPLKMTHFVLRRSFCWIFLKSVGYNQISILDNIMNSYILNIRHVTLKRYIMVKIFRLKGDTVNKL